MPNDPLPPSAVVDPPAGPTERRKRCTCEYCGCTLTADGEIIKLGDDARKFRDQEDEIKRLNRELATAREKLAAAPEKKKGFLDF